MPTTATATDAIIRPYPTRRLNHGPKVASAKDTMPSAKSPALVDRNAVAFNIGPSERRVRSTFGPRLGPEGETRARTRGRGERLEGGAPGGGTRSDGWGAGGREQAPPGVARCVAAV